jgi:enterochelin esterase family protein
MDSMQRLLIVLTALICLLAGLAPIQAQDQKPLTSPRLSALQKQLEAGNATVLENFWQEISKQGAPIIESIAGEDGYQLVTFLWRAKEETKNVVIVGGIAGIEMEQNQMARLGDTDLWFKTYRVRNDARFTYSLSPNDSLVPLTKLDPKDTKALMQRFAAFKADPLNPRRFPGLPPSSFVELPGAPPQPWITKQAAVPAGNLEWKKLKSAILNNERSIGIYTPPGYKTDGPPYGLLVLFDGSTYTLTVPTPVILDNLLAKNLLPPLVTVVVSNLSQESRNKELPCNADFADFLAKELVPWVRQNYHVTADPKQTVVAGSSYGGLASSFAAFRHPEIFGNVLSQSGSYWWKPEGAAEHEWLIKQFVANPKLPVRFYLDVGLMESGPTGDNGPSMVIVNRHMRDVLQAKGYVVHYREFNGGHEYLNWRGTLADGLLLLLGKEEAEKKNR